MGTGVGVEVGVLVGAIVGSGVGVPVGGSVPVGAGFSVAVAGGIAGAAHAARRRAMSGMKQDRRQFIVELPENGMRQLYSSCNIYTSGIPPDSVRASASPFDQVSVSSVEPSKDEFEKSWQKPKRRA
jgi:hypothetical protein